MSTNRDRRRKTKWENNNEFHLKMRLLKNYALNLFEWKNLPPTIDERYLERTLYHQGKVLWFNHTSFGLLALAYTGAQTLNMYGEPTHFIVNAPTIPYTERDIKSSVPMYNNVMKLPTYDIVYRYAKRLYELERTIDINTMAQRVPYIILTDPSQKLTFQAIYDKLITGEPVIFADNKSVDIENFKVLETTAPYNADKLTDLRHDLQNDFFDILGVANANYTKKERLNADEVQSNNAIVELAQRSWLDERKKACKLVNEKFGTDISVDFKVKEENASGVLDNTTTNNSE